MALSNIRAVFNHYQHIEYFAKFFRTLKPPTQCRITILPEL